MPFSTLSNGPLNFLDPHMLPNSHTYIAQVPGFMARIARKSFQIRHQLVGPEILTYLPSLENRITHDPILNGIVIRPPLVHGYSGSLLAPMYKSAAKGKALWAGTPGARLSMIHVEDISDLYVKAAERAQLVGGQTFDAVNSFTESVEDVLRRLVEVSGASGYELTTPSTPSEKAINTTTLIRPYLARSLLDWSPKKPGLVDGMDIYYAAWLATQNDKSG